MQDSKEKQCLIFVRNNANDTADRIEAYAKKSGMKVVETVFNTDKKAVERLLAAEHGISINDESRGYEPALISFE